jgi:DNA-binding transcriptional regulator GbsR (MarR family)
MKKTDENVKNQLVEKIGIVYEKAGHTPMAGRIAGVLFLSEPPYKSFDELVKELSASKSAISNALNMLLAMGLVEYETFSGDRKRYFKLNLLSLETMFKRELENIANFSGLLKKVREARSPKYWEFNEGIDDFIKLIDIFQAEYPQIIEKWKK